jgi:hypothetical protein
MSILAPLREQAAQARIAAETVMRTVPAQDSQKSSPKFRSSRHHIGDVPGAPGVAIVELEAPRGSLTEFFSRQAYLADVDFKQLCRSKMERMREGHCHRGCA